MTTYSPAAWWPIPVHPAADGTAENDEVVFTLKDAGGAVTGPYTATIAAGVALPWPDGYAAWQTIFEYCAGLEAAMEAAAVADGLDVAWSVNNAGVLTLTVAAPAGMTIAFDWANPGENVAGILGFDTSDAAYSAAKVGIAGHSNGWYCGSEASAYLEADSGDDPRDVAVTEAQSYGGAVCATGAGGIVARDVALRLLSADQVARLQALAAYGKGGGGIVWHPYAVAWAAVPLSHVLAGPTRASFRAEPEGFGIERYKASLALIVKSW